jgi:DASH complex subunit DAD1
MAWLNSTPGSGGRAASPTVFEQQREELVREIAVVSLNTPLSNTFHKIFIECELICCLRQSMEQVLQNINRLNRNLESIITVRSIPLLLLTLPASFANSPRSEMSSAP